jgi:hypothetical protein
VAFKEWRKTIGPAFLKRKLPRTVRSSQHHGLAAFACCRLKNEQVLWKL